VVVVWRASGNLSGWSLCGADEAMDLPGKSARRGDPHCVRKKAHPSPPAGELIFTGDIIDQ
jgi:hypothetical protein